MIFNLAGVNVCRTLPAVNQFLCVWLELDFDAGPPELRAKKRPQSHGATEAFDAGGLRSRPRVTVKIA
jgi:hypothetical protein